MKNCSSHPARWRKQLIFNTGNFREVDFSNRPEVVLEEGASVGASVFLFCFGVLFSGIGVWMWRRGTTPIVFDKQRQRFWKDRKAPHEVFNKDAVRDQAAFGEIHALQIVVEHVQSENSTYQSYELNLVLADGRRINLVDHGSLSRLQADAARLAEFLERPLWDAS